MQVESLRGSEGQLQEALESLSRQRDSLHHDVVTLEGEVRREGCSSSGLLLSLACALPCVQPLPSLEQAAHLARPSPQVASLKKQHNILSAEADGAAAQLAAAQAEAAELRAALDDVAAQRMELSQASNKSAAEVGNGSWGQACLLA